MNDKVKGRDNTMEMDILKQVITNVNTTAKGIDFAADKFSTKNVMAEYIKQNHDTICDAFEAKCGVKPDNIWYDETENAIKASKTADNIVETVEQRFQQIVNQQLQSTIPKSIGDTDIQYKTVLYDNSLATEVKIYLKTITKNNDNLCRTFGIAICVPPVCNADADIMLDYLSNRVRYSLESLLVRLTKGILANDLTTVTDTENTN